MKKVLFKIWLILKETVKKFQDDDPVIYAAAIAFFTVFSLPSVLIIIVKVSGLILGETKITFLLSKKVASWIGAGTTRADQIQKIIENRALGPSEPWVEMASIVFLFLSATVIFTFLKKALNAIWGVKPKPKQNITQFIKDGFRSFVLIVFLSGLLLVVLSVQAMLTYLNHFTTEIFESWAIYVNDFTDYLVSWVIISGTFALVFKYLPDARVRWRDILVGASVTGILFMIGRYLISLILSNTSVATIYGAAGSLAGLLIWVFYSSILLLVGAIFTQVYATQIGTDIEPKKDSVRVVTQEV